MTDYLTCRGHLAEQPGHPRRRPGDVVDAIDANGVHTLAFLDTPTCTGDGCLVSDLMGAEDSGVHHIIDRETLRPLLSRYRARRPL
jgi:hypothetical protein